MIDMVLVANAAPLNCTYCTEGGWADGWWIRNVPGVIIGVGTTLIAYLFKKRGEDKAVARNLAKSVRNEISHILELLNDVTRTAIRVRPFAAVDRIPTDIYDGLLNSATVSKFDVDLQDELYRFYNLFKGKHVDEIQVSEKSLRKRAVRLSENLDIYIQENRSRLRFF